MTGWVYLVALLVTIASVAYGAGPYLDTLLGIDGTVNNTVLTALGLLAVATIINLDDPTTTATPSPETRSRPGESPSEACSADGISPFGYLRRFGRSD